MKIAFIILGLHVMCFQTTAQKFLEIKKVVAPERHNSAMLGTSVAISGNYAIAGAAEYSGPASTRNSTGRAYIYEQDNSKQWTLKQVLSPDDPVNSSQFGCSVSISGDHAIVGAYLSDGYSTTGEKISCGAAYIFERNSNGNWVQVQKITPSDPKVFVFFGYAVSISGNHAIVGSYDDNTNALGKDPRSHAGSAYIYERDQSGKWNQIQKIVPKDRVAKDAFGISVNISGEVAMIGAFEALKKNQKQGKAYLFTRNESGTWDEYQRIIGPDGGLFGWKVSMDENQAVIGAPDVNNIGVAYVYEKDQGQFIQKTKLSTSDDSSFLNEFGFAVSISGNFILIGADLADKSGVAYVFEKVFGQWVFKQKLKARDFSNSSLFGFSVGISKNRIVIGAPWDSKDEHGQDVSGMFRAGSAYFFEEPVEEKLKDANELCENLDVDYTIPNVITPNGDSFNEKFVIENLQEGTSLKIINRYGKSVFEEKKYLNDWNGEQLSAGTYFYVIRQESKNCFYEWRGWLSIIK